MRLGVSNNELVRAHGQVGGSLNKLLIIKTRVLRNDIDNYKEKKIFKKKNKNKT